MKKIIAISLVVLSLVAIAILPTLASVESDMQAAVGTANSNAKFDVKVNAPDTYKAGSSISVVVTIENIKVSAGVSLVEFEFNYDASKLTLTNPNNDPDNALTCVTKRPDDSFENLSSSKGNGLVTVSLCTMDVGPAAKNNGDITFTFNFDVKSDAEGDLGFYVKHSSVYGATMLADAPYTEDYDGNGSYDISVKFAEPVSKPEESKPATSTPEVSKPEVSQPEVSKPVTSTPEDSDVEVGDDESDTSDESSAVSDGESANVSDEVSVESAASSEEVESKDASIVSETSSAGENGGAVSQNKMVPLVIAVIAVVAAAAVIVIIVVRRKNVQ